MNPDPLFSLSNTGATPRGMPKYRVREIADEFLENLNVPETIEIDIYANLRDILGSRAAALGKVKGCFYPATRANRDHPHGWNTVLLIHTELSSRRDVEQTLCHEILGHYGINLLPPDAKRRLLEAVDRSRSLPSVRHIAASVERAYPNLDRFGQAEEILAQAAENLPSNVFAKAFQQVALVLAAGLRKIGLLKGQVTMPEMVQHLNSVATAIRRGVHQRTYPSSRTAQFIANEPSRAGSGSTKTQTSHGSQPLKIPARALCWNPPRS